MLRADKLGLLYQMKSLFKVQKGLISQKFTSPFCSYMKTLKVVVGFVATC